MGLQDYTVINVDKDFLDRLKPCASSNVRPVGLQVSERRILSILGLSDDELQEKINANLEMRGDNRDFVEEKSRVIRTVIGVLRSFGGGILKDSRNQYLISETLLNDPDLFVMKYRENYIAFYRGERPII